MATDGKKLNQLPELTTLSDATMLYAVDGGEDYHVNFETIKDETVPEVFTPTKDGLVPHPNSGNGGKVLRGDGTWQGTFDSSNDGLVPKLGTNDKDNVLRGDGAWVANDKLIGSGSGSLVTFDAIEAPMPSLKVSVEAQQDLHGYDKPWVGGAGKNKLENTLSTITYNGVTFTVNNDGSMLLSGTASGTAQRPINNTLALKAGQYVLSGMAAGGSASTRMLYISDSNGIIARDTGNGATFTLAEDTTISVLCWINDGQTVNNVAIYPMIRLASEADATFTPYSNICPISGHIEANVTRCGKNLATESSGNNKVVGSVRKGCTYTFSVHNTGTIGFNLKKNSNSGYVVASSGSASSDETISVTFTADDNYNLFVNGYGSGGATYGDNASNYQLEIGSTATTYEPYNGVTTTISLGQTVYGGELDVVNGTSGNKLTHGLIEYKGTENWAKSEGYAQRFSVTVPISTTNISADKESNYLVSTTWGSDNYTFGLRDNGTIYVSLDNSGEDMTTEAFKAYLASHNLQVRYKLATPTTLTTQPTPIKSLNGTNNLSVDCGDVIEVEYQRSITEAINALEAGGGGSITEVIMGGLDRVYGTTAANYIGTFNQWDSIDTGKSFADYDEIMLIVKEQNNANYGGKTACKIQIDKVDTTLLQHYDIISRQFLIGSTQYVKYGLDYTNNKFYLENFNYACPIALVGVKY